MEALGYDGLFVPDAVHDGLLVAHAALAATERIRVATSVLVVFPRSPMVVAHAAWDLQELSGGRFELGLGSQVRGNVVGRYGTAWSPPVPRMREYIGALRALFECWQHGGPLRFEGQHYRLTRMQPFFRPDPLEVAEPPIYLGGIGPKMLALAGEAARGLVTHPTNTAPRYLREAVLPRLALGAARRGRTADAPELLASPLIATGVDAASLAAEREKARQLLGFLYSTPAYWPSLELFGWRERGERLRARSREGRWAELGSLIDDEMLDTFVPSGPFCELAETLRHAYAGLASWICLPTPADPAHDAALAAVIEELRSA